MVALLGALAAVGVVAGGWVEGRGGNFTLENARTFDEFPLYYAGEEVDGLPLTAVLARADGARYVSFVYGDCTPSTDAGCAPPAEIQVWPASARGLGSYDPAAPASPPITPTRLRGVSAAFVGETQLELYPPRVTVVVFAEDRQRAVAIAEALRCVRAGATSARGTLEC